MDKTKKAIILNNISSPYIQQAIIILKDNNLSDSLPESHILAEAEKVVSDYLHKGTFYPKDTKKKKNSRLKTALVLLIASLVFIICMFNK